MKLYKLIRIASDYNEYDGFVIWAKNRDEAMKLAADKAGTYAYECIAIELYEPKESQIVLASFKAG